MSDCNNANNVPLSIHKTQNNSMNKTSTRSKITTSPIEMKEELDSPSEFPYEPGANVINNILNYSKALSIRKSKNLVHFEMVLN